MYKEFRESIGQNFRVVMDRSAREFKEIRSKEFSGEFAGSLIFSWKPTVSVEIWIVLHFLKDRNYVMVRTYWSSLARSPKPSDCFENVIAIDKSKASKRATAKVLDYLACAEGVVDAADFCVQGCEGKFYINEVPPRDRIGEAMASAEAQDDLADLDLETDTGGWEGSEEWDNWDSVETYGGGLNEGDIKAAVTKTSEDVAGFVVQHILPFARHAGVALQQ